MVRNICPFRKFYKKLNHTQGTKKYREGIEEAIDDCAFQDGMVSSWDDKEKLEWANEGFASQSTKLELSADLRKSLEALRKVMTNISESESDKERRQYLKEKRIPEGRPEKDSQHVPFSKHPEIQSGSVDGGSPKISLFKKIRSGKVDPKDICIACRAENKVILSQHPVFEGGICDDCKERLKNYLFVLDADGSMIACAVCAHTGEVIVCDKRGCTRVYCEICLHELACENAISKFKAQNPWHCMVCRGYECETDGYLVPKENWWDNVTQLFEPHINHQEMDHAKKIERKDGIRVLSLFDGIGTGYYCLSQLGFNIIAYYALEIDSNAINVSKMNFADKIIQLGDVEKFTYDKIAGLVPFDLVIGGSPCNDLSAVNPARKGLYDAESTGRLFFEYYRVLTTVQSLSINPVFWFYENVASMPLPFRHIISRFLNCEPCLIDAKHFSAQRRPRFYWGNIPGLSSLVEFIPNSIPNLSSALMTNCKRTAAVDKLNTVTTQCNSLKTGNQHPVIMDGQLTNIWVTELEQVFGFPCHFTDVGNLLPQQRLGLLGKSWSVHVISNILSSLKHFFHTKPVVNGRH
ncbi:DNA (cytosine-5)-methyltransferase 3B-like [Ischnura elegans]|uniref:DNA (cytosine-5)-methyltransferase 3B-like n=1 Tax=Ischnura elegans TaxID=197161 RepID=UPI001ED8B0B2|nr:DNA (cytosine-5)-methyltransferase 3B-like [Ischnura elegans]